MWKTLELFIDFVKTDVRFMYFWFLMTRKREGESEYGHSNVCTLLCMNVVVGTYSISGSTCKHKHA